MQKLRMTGHAAAAWEVATRRPFVLILFWYADEPDRYEAYGSHAVAVAATAGISPTPAQWSDGGDTVVWVGDDSDVDRAIAALKAVNVDITIIGLDPTTAPGVALTQP